MKVLFEYEYAGIVMPCVMMATCMYYSPDDGMLNISDGIDWYELECTEKFARDHLWIAFRDNSIKFAQGYVFRFCS